MTNRRETDALAELGTRVQKRRLQLGLTQEQVSERCGFHVTYISQVERGTRNLSLTSLLVIAASLEFAPERLIAGLSAANRAAGT